MLNWFRNVLNFFRKGKYEVVYSTSAKWKVKWDGTMSTNEYSYYEILHNKIKNHYILKEKGYMPKAHTMYGQLFKLTRKLNEGDAYVKGGEIYSYTEKTVSLDKEIKDMNETECRVYLAKAIKEENYELAEQIRKQLEKYE
jgi:hypothetical protein